MRKDLMAAGLVRKQNFHTSGTKGDPIELRNIAADDDPIRSEEVAVHAVEKQTVARKRSFTPLGTILLVRRAEAKVIGFGDMNAALAAPKTGPNQVVIVSEQTSEDAPCEGLVLKAGPKAGVTEGSTIVFDKYAGQEYKLNGETLLLMEEDRVKGTLDFEDGDDYVVPVCVA